MSSFPLIQDWLSCFKVLHYYHFLLCRANAAWDMHWRNREKRNDQEHHEKASFFSSSWVLEWFFCFVFEKMSSSHPMLLVMLLAHIGKRANSRSQMSFKTNVLKYFAIITGKHLCWSLFLIKFQYWRPSFLFKKRLQHRRFSMNIAKCVSTIRLQKTCSLYLFKILFDDR